VNEPVASGSDGLGLPCVHCGLCLDTCPTYRVLGTEADSPRGRIYIMESVRRGELELDAEAAGHLDGCLGCLACETACPSGVSFGRRIEEFRPRIEAGGAIERGWDSFVRWFTDHETAFAAGNRMARVLDAVGLERLRRRLPGFGLLPGRSAGCEGADRSPLHRSRTHQPVTPKARVVLLTGCVGDRALPDINRAAVEVLQANEIEVVDAPGQGCCGALDLHAGRPERALELARANIAVFARMLREEGVESIVATAAGCGAMLRDYARLLADDAQAGEDAAAVAGASCDISELLCAVGIRPPEHPAALEGSVVYHDACHLLHAQKVASPPRRVVEAAVGYAPPDLGENHICCGSAGSYSLEHPAMSLLLGARKADLAGAGGVTTIAVANSGCILQLARATALAGRKVRVVHPVELLAEAYRRSEASPEP
jgi:glycolate oxidase iron-sulfur subunit